MRVFVAGASGAIGEPLIAELLKRGHSVVGMTTSEARAKNLEGQGAEAAIVNALDAPAVEVALRRSKVVLPRRGGGEHGNAATECRGG
jgi:nucleoside-diphosphate-sugar epimerase